MSRNLSSMWPDGVSNDLWNYDRAFPGVDANKIFPMSSYQISQETVVSFLIGLVVVWLYSWNRFNRRTYEPASFDYRVLRESQPSQMRDTMLVQRGFILYAVALSLIYACLTFFGGIILKIAEAVPEVGPLGVDPQMMQDNCWPLVVAFALVGLTQLIGPLDHLEKMLRGHIHRSLGIPISIKEYTRQLIATQLKNLSADAVELRDKISPKPQTTQDTGPIEVAIKTLSQNHVGQLHPWARDEIAQTYGVEDVLGRLVLLWRMIDSLYSPNWPRESARDELRVLLSRQMQEGRAAALYLSDLMSTKQADEKTSDGAAIDADAQMPMRTRQEQQLIAAIESMDRHVYEMAEPAADNRHTTYRLDHRCQCSL